MASGRQVTYTLNLNSNVSTILQQTEKDASKLDNSMWQLQKTLASFGLGLGAHYIIDAAKNWTQGAADFELAMMRIKNASQEGFGMFNEKFVSDQVDKYKLKLQETSDAYGQFLFKMKNAHLSNRIEDNLFNELNIIGKIGGLSEEQMKSTIYQTSLLLGEGVLEARHLRPLTQSHPNLIPYIADELGLKSGEKDEFSGLLKGDDDLDANQKLSLLITKSITKLGISSKDVLLPAYEKYANDLMKDPSKLKESLETLQSDINQIDNSWLRFKNHLILSDKNELVGLFHTLEGGIDWLKGNEDSIIANVHALGSLIEILLTYKASQLIVSGVTKGYNAILAITNASIDNEAKSLGFSTFSIDRNISSTDRLKSILELQNKARLEGIALMEREIALQAELVELHRTHSYNASGSVLGLAGNPGGLIPGNSVSERLAYLEWQEMQAMQAFTLPINNRGQLAESAIGASRFNGILGGISSLVGGALPVAVTFMALDIIEKIGSYTHFKGEYNNASPNEKLELDKKGALENIRSINSFWNTLLPGNYGERKYINEDESHFGLGRTSDQNLSLRRLRQLHPEILNDTKFVDEIMRLLDVRGDKKLIELAEEEGFHHSALYDAKTFGELISGNAHYANEDPHLFDQWSKVKMKGLPEGKDSSHIRGNSSNYVTINIHEMNGIKGYTAKFDKTGTKVEEERIAELVGMNLVKILTGVVNDSQLVGRHH